MFMKHVNGVIIKNTLKRVLFSVKLIAGVIKMLAIFNKYPLRTTFGYFEPCLIIAVDCSE